jgi:hypothetical protein
MKRGRTEEWSGTENHTLLLCSVVSKILFKSTGRHCICKQNMHSSLEDKGEFGHFNEKGRVRACMVNQCPAWQSIIDKKRRVRTVRLRRMRAGESQGGASGHQLPPAFHCSNGPLCSQPLRTESLS